jgi:glutamyl-tRNA synthetase
MSVRVRFAPSPTGYLHVGGLRTALYNYLFAKHHGGKMILRIEDTDRTRFVEGAAEQLMESLRWAGIEFDESKEKGGEYGPYVQSERNNIYSKHIDTLLENDKAYIAFDTPEQIEKMRELQKEKKQTPKYDRAKGINQYTLGADDFESLKSNGTPYVIRLKVPENHIVEFNDIIRGNISVNTNEIDDQVLVKSDGFPTYHLANVVDDYSMKISHVIRGEEWLPSTPKHVLLYQAFGWDVPDFAHLPLLLNDKKQKLSKRHGDVAVEDFRKKGFIRDAFVNFIALLGWNPSADREIYTIDELISLFNLSKVNKAGAVFDLNKLNWMNQQYMKEADLDELADFIMPELINKGFSDIDKEYLKKVIALLTERIELITELPDYAPYFFTEEYDIDEQYKNKVWNDEIAKVIVKLSGNLNDVKDWTHDGIKEYVKQFCTENDIKMGKVMNPLRLVLTGRNYGVGMFDVMELIGQEKSLTRIHRFIENNS